MTNEPLAIIVDCTLLELEVLLDFLEEHLEKRFRSLECKEGTYQVWINCDEDKLREITKFNPQYSLGSKVELFTDYYELSLKNFSE